jgi:TPP-dependent 2-oxoacid decarboxylase
LLTMSDILVGAYLFERLKQLGVKTIFGVPGGEFCSRLSYHS